ncbi:hypothetical protein BGZ49_003912 [Haplosporangium sp. Z 27]|nr:hypothetical protein BGZ49_003912 [Haplosporangium sp. Z 27]
MKFAESCDRLESFTIQGHSLLNTTEYWESCKRVIIRNQPHLRSLSMINWMSQYRGSPAMPHIAWNPISECSQALNLRTLKLENSCIGLKDLPAFWKICERLEELTLDSANLELSLLPSLASNRKRVRNEYDDEELLESSSLLPSPPPSPYSSSSCSNTTSISSMEDDDDDGHDEIQHILFPRLRKLRLCGMNWVEPIDQLCLLIQSCPVLQTLYWQIDKRKSCPSAEFVELFLASTWPDLDSITITDQCKPLFSRDQYHQILQGFSNSSSDSPTVVMDSKRAPEQDQQQQQGQPQPKGSKLKTSCKPNNNNINKNEYDIHIITNKNNKNYYGPVEDYEN